MIISLDKYKVTGGGGEKPTEVLTQTITQNGSQTFNPQEGYVFSSAEITTDVHPTEALVATIDKNSTYHFIGEYNGADITTDIHPTEALVTTINENGSRHFDGEYNGADITTNIHPTQALIATINENGSRHFDGEYNGADITVDVATFTPTGNVDITANGIYDVANYATASVNVQPSGNYSYFDGVVDVEGLKAIGWDDASIGMYRDNDRHYAWQNSDYIVSEENKALYGVIVDKASISSNKNNPNFKYCPFIRSIDDRFTRSFFYDCKSLISIPLLDTSNWTDMNGAFSGCRSLTTIPQLDTSKVTDMREMLFACMSLTSIPQLDTSNVTNMYGMLEGCTSLTSIPQLDTSKVTEMAAMLDGCTSLTSIPQLYTSNVTSMSSMLKDCSSLTYIPLLDTSNVTSMNNMFEGCSLLTSIPLLDTSKVINMSNMFYRCSLLTSIPLLDTSNVTDMSSMFYNCTSLTSIPQLNTSNVTTMYQMFNSCSALTSIPLLDTSNVTNMDYLFGWGDINTLTDLGGFKNLSISITSYFLDKCPNLTVDSLMNVINNLATVSGQTLKFGSTNLNKLTAEQIGVATAKGWTLT